MAALAKGTGRASSLNVSFTQGTILQFIAIDLAEDNSVAASDKAQEVRVVEAEITSPAPFNAMWAEAENQHGGSSDVIWASVTLLAHSCSDDECDSDRCDPGSAERTYRCCVHFR